MLFTPVEREETARQLSGALAAEEGVERVVPFGSLTIGSADRHSDVDLGVVVAPEVEIGAAADACTRMVLRTLPVLHYFSQEFDSAELRSFLLDSFLEIDLGFGRAADFDEPDVVPPVDAKGKLDYVWHDVVHAAIALDRGRRWRALWYVDRLRNGALELAAGRLGRDTRHFAEVDELPAESLAIAEGGIAGRLTDAELWRALRGATTALFAEGRHTHPEIADKLEPRLVEFLDLMQQGDAAP